MPALHSVAPQEVLRQVRRIEIRTRKMVNALFSGQYSSVFKGRGMSFSQVREYQPGDDPKQIDWNVTARTGHLFTKEFTEERELSVAVLVDASRSLFFGSRSRLKSETAAELAALLSFSAIRNNDKVGLVLFTDKVEKYIPPGKGRESTLRLIRDILTFEPQGHGTNLNAGLEFTAKVFKRHAVCFLISDFLSPYNYEKALRAAAKRHDVVALRVADPIETRIPAAGRFLTRDMETGRLRALDLRDENLREEMARELARTADSWKRNMAKNNVDVVDLRVDRPYAAQLLSFFRARAKRFR